MHTFVYSCNVCSLELTFPTQQHISIYRCRIPFKFTCVTFACGRRIRDKFDEEEEKTMLVVLLLILLFLRACEYAGMTG